MQPVEYKPVMALSAMIFDVDGTLIDSNQSQLDGWMTALQQHGYVVSEDRIAVEIGKGGDKLVPSVLGHRIEQAHGKSLRKAQAAAFKRIASSTRLKMFPGAEDLLRELRRRGLKTALCTSSGKGALDVMRDSSGFNWTLHFDEIVTAEDATQSKPAPHLLEATFKKLGMSPAQCAMVGDTPYDAQTARDAGAVSLGVLCGKLNDAKTLRSTGMRKAYHDPREILTHLDEALAIASPGSRVMTCEFLEKLMRDALAVAREGLDRGEAPIGCVIARGDGTIIARAHNQMNARHSKTAHAEIVAFEEIAGSVPTDARDLILCSTLEPCVMCLGAAMEAAVDTVVLGLHAPSDGGRTRVSPPVSEESQMPRMVGDILAEESRKLFESFSKMASGNPLQARFTRELLKTT